MMASFIRSSFSFFAGTALGVYIAQNYNVPNVNTVASTALSIASHIEQAYRKPKNKQDSEEQAYPKPNNK